MTNTSSVRDSVTKGKELIATATKRAKAIEEEALKEAAIIKKAAQEQGLEEGKQSATRALLSAQSLKSKTLLQLKREMFEISLAIAEEVICDEIKQNPQSIQKRVSRALKDTVEAKQVILELNPADVSFIRKHLNNVSTLTNKIPISLIENSNITRGNAIIKTDISVIEATTNSHLKAIREHFLRNDQP